jgi:hypothetical protein
VREKGRQRCLTRKNPHEQCRPIDVSDRDPVLAKAIQRLSVQEASDRVARDPTLHGLSRMRIYDPQRKPEIAATIRTLMNNFGAAKHCGSAIQGQTHGALDSRSRASRVGNDTPVARASVSEFIALQ